MAKFNKICDKCGCNEFYMKFDGHNIQLRCAEEGHWLRNIGRNNGDYERFAQYEDVRDDTGFIINKDINSNITNLNSYKLSKTANGYESQLHMDRVAEKKKRARQSDVLPKSVKHKESYVQYKQATGTDGKINNTVSKERLNTILERYGKSKFD